MEPEVQPPAASQHALCRLSRKGLTLHGALEATWKEQNFSPCQFTCLPHVATSGPDLSARVRPEGFGRSFCPAYARQKKSNQNPGSTSAISSGAETADRSLPSCLFLPHKRILTRKAQHAGSQPAIIRSAHPPAPSSSLTKTAPTLPHQHKKNQKKTNTISHGLNPKTGTRDRAPPFSAKNPAKPPTPSPDQSS